MYFKELILAGVASLLFAIPSYAIENRYTLKDNTYSQNYSELETRDSYFNNRILEEILEDETKTKSKALGRIILEDLRISLKHNWSKYEEIERIIKDYEHLKQYVEVDIPIFIIPQSEDKTEEITKDTVSYNMYNRVKFQGVKPGLRLGIESVNLGNLKEDLYLEYNLVDLKSKVKYSLMFLYLEGSVEYRLEDNEVVSSINFTKNF